MQITGRVRWAEKFAAKLGGADGLKAEGEDFSGKVAPSVSA
jgi:hypothetical protein